MARVSADAVGSKLDRSFAIAVLYRWTDKFLAIKLGERHLIPPRKRSRSPAAAPGREAVLVDISGSERKETKEWQKKRLELFSSLKLFQRRDGSFIFSQYNGNIPDASDKRRRRARGLTSFAGSSREVSGELPRFKLFMKASHIGKRFREKDCVTLRNLVSPRNGIAAPGEVHTRAPRERSALNCKSRAESSRQRCVRAERIHH